MNRLVLSLAFVLSIFSGCSKITPKYDVTFEIRKPDALQVMNISEELISSFENSIQSISTGNTMAEPTALTELSCVGVLVGYTSAPRLGTCIFNSGAEVAVGQFGGLVPYNGSGASEIRVENLIGDQQIDVYAVGFKTSNSTCAKLVPGVDPKEGTGAEYSEPYILGAISGFLAGGKNNFFQEIKATFDSNYRVDDCRGPLFNKDSVLRDGLVAFWDFESDNGIVTQDLTNTYFLNFSSAAITSGVGKNSSRALSLANVNQFAQVTSDSNDFSIQSNSVSYSFWVKKGTGGSATDTLVKKSSSTDLLEITLSSCASSLCNIHAYVNATSTTCANVNLSNFKNISVVYTKPHISGIKMEIYVDGNYCNSNVTAGGGSGSSTALRIGTAGSVAATTVLIDSLGVWQRPLRDFEIKALYNNGLGKEYPFE